MAAKIATEQKCLGIILGDRLYSTTIQRVFDKLTNFEKLKVGFILTWEVITMSFWKLADYIKKTENDENFIKEEMLRFRKFLPSFASVIIDERDEYLAQSIIETGEA
jgi:pheromone shutdown protein TraB